MYYWGKIQLNMFLCLVTFRFAKMSFNLNMSLVFKEYSFTAQVLSSNLRAIHGVAELMVMMESMAEI